MLKLALDKVFVFLRNFRNKKNLNTKNNDPNQKKILIVDDHKINLIALKTKIEKLLPTLLCDIAVGGREAIKKAKENNYNLIIMDLQMPDIDGIEASKIIREYSPDTPIIAATSLSYETFMEEVGKRGDINHMIDYVPKTAPSNYFMRAIAKHILSYKDDFSYLGNDKELIYNVLKDKKIILADDQDINKVMVGKILSKYQVLSNKVSDGQGILNLYKDSLDNSGKSNIDAIITDINMLPLSGDDASKEIRKIELENKILFADRIPIIAISGDNSLEMVNKLFKSGMDDYFSKGDNFDNLAKILANFFVNIDIKDGDSAMSKSGQDNNAEIGADKIFNSSFIDNFSKDEKLELIKLFLEDSANTIANIKKYYANKDLELLNINLHSLKGIVANFGAEKLSTYIKSIDKSVKNNCAEADWVDNINNLYSELVAELEKYYLN